MHTRPTTTPGRRTWGARSGQQEHSFPQTNQRHATAATQALNRKLQRDNDTLRAQNAALARELNDVKAKLKKKTKENMDLQRRSNQLEFASSILETRTRSAPTAASPTAIPAAFISAASGRSHGLWSVEAVQSPVGGRRGSRRRSSILPNSLDLGCGDRLRTPAGRSLPGTGEENERPPRPPPQEGAPRTPPPPPSRTQPHSPLSIKGGASSRSFGTPSDGNSSGGIRRSSASKSLDPSVAGGGEGGGFSRRLELLEGGSGGGRLGGVGCFPENAVIRMEALEGARDDHASSRPSSGAMEASPAPNRPWTTSSYPPGLLALNRPSDELRSPDDVGDDDGDGDDALDDSADDALRRPPPGGWLEPRDTARTTSEAGRSTGQGSLSGGGEAAPEARAGRDRRASGQSSPRSSAWESSPELPRARSRPLVSTPMPPMGQAPLSARRPRRDVARPISYEEPSLSVKMRKGHVMFPKTRLPLIGIPPETEQERKTEGHAPRTEEKHSR
eukprot:g7243.t1